MRYIVYIPEYIGTDNIHTVYIASPEGNTEVVKAIQKSRAHASCCGGGKVKSPAQEMPEEVSPASG